jgi:hypothetical protein
MFNFRGYTGTTPRNAAQIEVYVDGVVGASSVPGRITFSTTAVTGTAASERMRINSGGIVLIGKTAAVVGSTAKLQTSTTINIGVTATHADNAAAKTAGLVNGDVYRKADGTLMVAY